MKKSILKNVIFKLLLNVFNLIVPIIIGPYVLRALGPDLMGTVNFAQSIYGYFYIFASFGVYQYGLREISKIRDDKEKLINVYSTLFVVTMITSILTTFSYVLFIYTQYHGEQTYIACIVLTANLLSNIFYTEWINEALENYQFIALKTIAVRIVYLILLFIMVKTSENLLEYLFLLVLSNFLNNIISFIYIKKRIKFNFKNIKISKHFKPMLLVVILSNASVFYTQLDKVMLGEFIDKSTVAYYTVAQNISNMVNTLLLTVIHVTIPRLSNYSSKDNKEKYIFLLKKVSNIYFMILFPCGILIFMLSNEIISIYGGSEYMMASPILSIFSIYIITLGFESILSNQVMYVNNREKQQVKLVFLCGVINLICNIILVLMNKFNGVSAILSTTLSNFILIMLQYIYIKYSMKFKFNIFDISNIKYFLISLFFIPIVIVSKIILNSSFSIIILSVIISIIVYIIILLMIKDDNFREMRTILSAKVSRRIKLKERSNNEVVNN